MASGSAQRADVLVLGGGGILGEAWMSALLCGLEESSAFDARGCERYLGTSAGSIVAAGLVAGRSPRARLLELPQQPAIPTNGAIGERSTLARLLGRGRAAAVPAAAPLAALTLRSTATGGALVRRAALSAMPSGHRSLSGLGAELERSGACFDGRLLIAAVDLGSGRRVVFGAPEAPDASVAEAVEASCAIPGVFRPIVIGGRSYVDGGAWSPTNMDVVPVRRGARVLCLNPTGSLSPRRATPLGALGALSRSIAGVEALALQRRGARVTTIMPDSEAIAAIGGNLMDPGRRSQVVRAGLAQGRRLAGNAAA